MTNEEIHAKLASIISQKVDRRIAVEQVKLGSRLREDLGIDSLAVTEMLYEIEEAFGEPGASPGEALVRDGELAAGGRLVAGSLGARLGAVLDANVAGAALSSAEALGSGDVDGTVDGSDTDVHPAIAKISAVAASPRRARVNMCARP